MASTVTYNWPVASPGTTVAPTTTQTGPGGSSIVTAQVVFADADTTATVTHNFQLSTTELSNGFPLVILNRSASGTASATIVIALTNSVAITITKAGDAGSAFTGSVSILRPWSGIR